MKRRSIATWHCMPVQPVFIVGTFNPDGTPDFAPITWVSKTCEKGDDCLIVISMYGSKQTKLNAMRTRCLTLNLASTDMLPLVDYFGSTSGKKGAKAALPYEWEKAGAGDAPTLNQSRWVCECQIAQTVSTGESDTFFCKILNVQMDESVPVQDFGVDLTLLDPVVYSGDYHSIAAHLGRIGGFYPGRR